MRGGTRLLQGVARDLGRDLDPLSIDLAQLMPELERLALERGSGLAQQRFVFERVYRIHVSERPSVGYAWLANRIPLESRGRAIAILANVPSRIRHVNAGNEVASAIERRVPTGH